MALHDGATNAQQSQEEDLRRLREQFVPRGVATTHPLFVEHARGTELWDVKGRRGGTHSAGVRRS